MSTTKDGTQPYYKDRGNGQPARFNDLSDPETVPQATKYVRVVDSDVPMVAQHICLDSRQAEDALLTAILPEDCRSFDIGALFGVRGFHEGLQKD